ncbi:hypothetical protein, partial [Mycobacterium tuberculosis]
MRRPLRDVAKNRELGDTSTLLQTQVFLVRMGFQLSTF